MKTIEYFILIIAIASVLVYFIAKAIISRETLTEKLLKKITADIRGRFSPLDLGMHRISRQMTGLPREMQANDCRVKEQPEGTKLSYRLSEAEKVVRAIRQAVMTFPLASVNDKTQSFLPSENEIFRLFIKYSGEPFAVTLTDKGKYRILTVTRLDRSAITTA